MQSRGFPSRFVSISLVVVLACCSVRSQQPLYGSPESRPASAPLQSETQPRKWEPLLLDLARHVSSAFSEQGIRSWFDVGKAIRIRDRLVVEAKLIGTLQLPREVWASFFERILPAGTGVWIDDASFVIPSPTLGWTLKTLEISAPHDSRPSPPSDLDGTKLQEWLSLVQTCAADPKGAEFRVKLRRMADSKIRFEAATTNNEAATNLRDRLKNLLTARGSEAKLVFFDDKTQVSIVVVSGEDFAVPDSRPAPTTRPSEPAPKLAR